MGIFYINEKDILKAKGEIVLHTGQKEMTTHMNSSSHFPQKEVFYYTEALVLFCNANVNIFFSWMNNVCVCECVHAPARANTRVNVCLCGMDCVGAIGLWFKSPCIIHPLLSTT